MAIGRLNIGLTGVQPGGLAKVIPSSVAVGSGSGTVDSNGNVTFSGASSVSLNGCFTSTYNNYRIIGYNLSGSTNGSAENMRLRVSGSDNSTSNYFRIATVNVGSLSVQDNTSSSSWDVMPFTSNIEVSSGWFICDLFNPQVAQRTYGTSSVGGFDTDTNGHRFYQSALSFNATTQFDGFTINTGGAGRTMSGTISVYGYN